LRAIATYAMRGNIVKGESSGKITCYFDIAEPYYMRSERTPYSKIDD
jgi:hypothetical protein